MGVSDTVPGIVAQEGVLVGNCAYPSSELDPRLLKMLRLTPALSAFLSFSATTAQIGKFGRVGRARFQDI